MCGDSVWGRSSFKLQIAHQHNPQDAWARFEGAFEGIVSRSIFARAQKVRVARTAIVTNEQLVARLRAIYRKHGTITARLIKKDRFLCVASIRKRFGSLIPAYELAGYRPKRDLAFIAHNSAAQRAASRGDGRDNLERIPQPRAADRALRVVRADFSSAEKLG